MCRTAKSHVTSVNEGLNQFGMVFTSSQISFINLTLNLAAGLISMWRFKDFTTVNHFAKQLVQLIQSFSHH